MNAQSPRDDITIERHGDITVINASPGLENIDPGLIEEVAGLMLEPLRSQDDPLLVVDLSRVDFFGSSFLSLLLRCWKFTKDKEGQMVLAGVSSNARELLRMTSLDMVWPIYSDRAEAMEALLAD